MKAIMVRMQVVELDDHDTNSRPDEEIIYYGERALEPNLGYQYSVVEKMEMEADSAVQQYMCEHEDIIDASDGFSKRCSDCGKDMTYYVEPDYDEIAKDERISNEQTS